MGMNAKELLSYDDLTRRMITVKKWKNLKLEIVEMNGEERNKVIEISQKDGKIDSQLFAEQVMLASVRDPETGQPFFDLETVKALQKKSWQALAQVATAVFDINGIGEKGFEEAEKN